jgi:hypothetical protein
VVLALEQGVMRRQAGASIREARLAADLPHVGADKAWERLDRLTETQRLAIEDVAQAG